MAYVVIARWSAKAGEEGAAAAVLSKLIPATRAEPGCLIYQAHRDPDDPRVFLLYEQYADEDAFQAHTESAHFRRYVLDEAAPHLESRQREFYVTWDGE
jgi:quinol monooxygenase YgiN